MIRQGLSGGAFVDETQRPEGSGRSHAKIRGKEISDMTQCSNKSPESGKIYLRSKTANATGTKRIDEKKNYVR